MDASKPIVFYDIASGPPVSTFAPNPWKTRYALNFKGVHYRTEWIDLPDVTATRKRLQVPANRKLPDGSDFYTLPIIQDHSNNDEIVGDSFDIAVYLDRVYPNGPTLLPPSTIGLCKAFNINVDAIFTNCVTLFVDGMPLNPATAEQSKRIAEERFPGAKWEERGAKGEARVPLFKKLKEGLADLERAYGYGRAEGEGVFLDGDTPTYADLIVGAWLQYTMRSITDNEWREMCSWHGGRWGRLHAALGKYAEIKA